MTPMPADKTVVPLNEKRSDDADTSSAQADMTKRLASVQDLLFGDAQREIVERLDYTDDLHNEFSENTAQQFQAMTEMFEKKIDALREELRAIDRAQTSKRRKLVGDLGDAIKAMAYDA